MEPLIRPIDWPGFALTAVGLSCLIFGFEVVGRGGLPVSAVVAMIGVGVLCLAAYVWHARRTAFPVLDLRLLEITTFRIGVTGGTLTRMGIGALPSCCPSCCSSALATARSSLVS